MYKMLYALLVVTQILQLMTISTQALRFHECDMYSRSDQCTKNCCPLGLQCRAKLEKCRKTQTKFNYPEGKFAVNFCGDKFHPVHTGDECQDNLTDCVLLWWNCILRNKNGKGAECAIGRRFLAKGLSMDKTYNCNATFSTFHRSFSVGLKSKCTEDLTLKIAHPETGCSSGEIISKRPKFVQPQSKGLSSPNNGNKKSEIIPTTGGANTKPHQTYIDTRYTNGGRTFSRDFSFSN